jgi:hypothetical protein
LDSQSEQNSTVEKSRSSGLVLGMLLLGILLIGGVSVVGITVSIPAMLVVGCCLTGIGLSVHIVRTAAGQVDRIITEELPDRVPSRPKP